jgi:hypothetical protein
MTLAGFESAVASLQLVGDAPDVIGNRVAQKFCHTGGFSHLPLECSKWDIGSLPLTYRGSSPR